VERVEPGASELVERDLLFCFLALRQKLIGRQQFLDACTARLLNGDEGLAGQLVARRWITDEGRRQIERLVEAELGRSGGRGADARSPVAPQTLVDALLRIPPEHDGESGEPDCPPPGADDDPRGRYEFLEDAPRRGGIGQVWRVFDRQLGRVLALKELRPEYRLDARARESFFREAQVTAQLTHPSIVPLYDFVHSPGLPPFCTMQFIEGDTLSSAVKAYHVRRRLGQEGVLEFRSLLTAFVSVCQAVHYAHERGVQHRDLKGTNVIVGRHGEVFLVDWGLAKARGDGGVLVVNRSADTETRVGDRLGTPPYMAPEQAAGAPDRVNERSDVYGLGAILYEILTGRPPFPLELPPDSSPQERQERIHRLYDSIQKDEPPPPRALNPGAPPALEAVCARAMHKEQTRRYDTPRHLGEEVSRWLAGEPVSAHAESWLVRAGRWANRNKPQVTAAALLLVTAATLSVLWVTEQDRTLLKTAQANTRAALRTARAAEAESRQKAQLIAGQRDLTQETIRALDDIEQMKCYFRKSLEIAQSRAEADPGDPMVQRTLAWACANTGDFWLRAGSPGDARALFTRRLEIARGIAERDPANREGLRDLAAACRELGELCCGVDRPVSARAYFEEFLNQARALVKLNPADAAARRDLFLALTALGKVDLQLGQVAPAVRYQEEAHGLAAELASGAPRDVKAQMELIESLKQSAALCHEQLDFPGAVSLLGEALAVGERLGAAGKLKGTRYALWPKFLAEEYEEMKELQRLADEPARLEGQPVERQRTTLEVLVRRRLRAGEPEEALRLTDRLARTKPPDARSQLQVARAYGRVLRALPGGDRRRDGVAAKAVESTRQAVGLGYRAGEVLRNHADLQALGGLPDFEAFLATLEAPSPAR
jgi:serine/threonine protein kinase